MEVLNIIALIIVALGCVNWGLIGVFNFNIFGKQRTLFNSIVYILVFIAMLWLIIAMFSSGGVIRFVR